MEVGIEDCLHIEFEYDKSKCVPYHTASTLHALQLGWPSQPPSARP